MNRDYKDLDVQAPVKKSNPLEKLAMFFAKIAERWLPDAFVFAILLTIVTIILGVTLTDSSPFDMVLYWGDGMWGLLTFTAQIATTFVMSYALVYTRPVSRFLDKVSSICKTPTSAIVVVTLSALIGSILSWALGLVIGGIMARLVGSKVDNVDYRVLVAAGYSGFLVWHGGFSSSSALFVATEGHVFEDLVGVIPISETVFSIPNMILVLFITITLPIVMSLIHPKNKKDLVIVDKDLLKTKTIFTKEKVSKKSNFSEKMDNSRLFTLTGGVLGLIYLIYYFSVNGFNLDLNILALVFLTAALLLYQNVRQLGEGLRASAGSVGQFLLQYPFYAGIMGMITLSGLGVVLSGGIEAFATEDTLPFFAFISAALLNMFIPSGGGQWAIQAPLILPTAIEMGVEPAKIVMAVAWGDAWTNMIQPFFAIPLLAIAGLKIRDIMGFTTIALLYSGVILFIVFLFLY